MSIAKEFADRLTSYQPGSQRYDVPVHLAHMWVVVAVQEALERAAQEAEGESRTWKQDAPDPQTRIAAKIRALKGDPKAAPNG